MVIAKNILSRLATEINMPILKMSIAFAGAILAPVQYNVQILFILVVLDLFVGVWKALRQHNFSSRRLRMGVGKIILYLVAIFAIRLVEQQFGTQTTIASRFLITFLSVTELVSLCESMIALGVPIPAVIIQYLGAGLRLDNFSSDKISTETMSNVTEIDALMIRDFGRIGSGDVCKMLGIYTNRCKEAVQAEPLRTPSAKYDPAALTVVINMMFAGVKSDVNSQWISAGFSKKQCAIMYKWIDSFSQPVRDFSSEEIDKLCGDNSNDWSLLNNSRETQWYECVNRAWNSISHQFIMAIYKMVMDAMNDNPDLCE